MRNRIALLSIVMALIFVLACTKRQRYLNRVGGKWRLTEKVVNGSTVNLNGKTTMFEFGCTTCGENTFLYFSDSDSAAAYENVTYDFSKNGKELTFMYQTKLIEKYDVIKLTSKKMELSSKQKEAKYKFDKEESD